MSHKYDIEEHPEMWSKEIVAAVENYINGKWNAKRILRKFVNHEISQSYYNELIERHSFSHHINKEKRNRKISENIKAILAVIILFHSMSCGLAYILEQYGKSGAFWYFFLWFWAFDYALRRKKQD